MMDEATAATLGEYRSLIYAAATEFQRLRRIAKDAADAEYAAYEKLQTVEADLRASRKSHPAWCFSKEGIDRDLHAALDDWFSTLMPDSPHADPLLGGARRDIWFYYDQEYLAADFRKLFGEHFTEMLVNPEHDGGEGGRE